MSKHRLKRNHVSLVWLTFIKFYLHDLECAALVKEGKVYGVGTEDMDVRTIGIFFLFVYFSSYF